MNRLWIRLSLTFGGVILIAFLSVSAISLALIRYNSEQSAVNDQQLVVDVLTAQLTRYYLQHEGWEGVSSLFDGTESPIPSDPRMLDFFTLRSLDGEVLFGRANEPPQAALQGEPPPENSGEIQIKDVTYPVVIDGETQAYLTLPTRRVFFPVWGMLRDFGIEELLIFAVITIAAISVVFGIVISRWLTKPLAHLAATAEEIGKGKTDRRVRTRGTTETLSLAHSFNTMVDKLQDGERMRRNLVADVAHELRTPISALQAGLYAILDDAYPMTKTEIAGLYEQTRMLSRLVNDLHELSQAEANQLPMNCQRLDLGKAIEDFVAPFRIVAEGMNILFNLVTDENLPMVNADKSRINQVLHNLLSNALRHTPEGGTITVHVSRTNAASIGSPTVVDGIQIAVSDTGEGITAEHLPHVFERFYRGDYGRSRDAGGTGLGLAIARAIVEAHQGKLSVASAGIPGQGATFTAQIPAA